jgi:hypothetical protein
MYLTNKYHQYYFIIINRAKSRNLPTDTYTEKHHIIPKSLGGNESMENIVKLTSREHFICHILLTKFTTGKDKSKMIFAVMGMKRKGKGQTNRYVNSRLYDAARLLAAKEFSLINKGRKHSDETKAKISTLSSLKTNSKETRAKISAALLGKKKSIEHIAKMKNHKHSEESIEKMKLANTGKKHSDEARAKMSASGKGKPKSEETKLKISLANKGKSKPPMSEELKKQISDKLRGRPSAKKGKIGIYKHSEETKAKIIESNKNRVYSQETKDKISAGVKAANLLKKKK